MEHLADEVQHLNEHRMKAEARCGRLRREVSKKDRRSGVLEGALMGVLPSLQAAALAGDTEAQAKVKAIEMLVTRAPDA